MAAEDALEVVEQSVLVLVRQIVLPLVIPTVLEHVMGKALLQLRLNKEKQNDY